MRYVMAQDRRFRCSACGAQGLQEGLVIRCLGCGREGRAPLTVLVTGSRDWTDEETIEKALRELPAGTLVIHGGARGADRLAGDVARRLGLRVQVFPADWNKHGKAAGYKRNVQMLTEGHPDLVLAFPLPGSKGTVQMMRIAREAGVPVKVMEPTVHTEVVVNRDGTRSRVLSQHVEDNNPVARCIACIDSRKGICFTCSRRKAKASKVTLAPKAITWQSCAWCGAPSPCRHHQQAIA